jgi:hypothetical protein
VLVGRVIIGPGDLQHGRLTRGCPHRHDYPAETEPRLNPFRLGRVSVSTAPSIPPPGRARWRTT